eukprot:GFUD01035484.1.p1 GENE.GFUD01035484.1~~GFUD01035484.1.p1  ORF type:complete len:1136 (+),score=438.78 GFUD01035484.1:195-3602(+)
MAAGAEAEGKKRSIEMEMENYLKTELSSSGTPVQSDAGQDIPRSADKPAPDIVQDLNNSMAHMTMSNSEAALAELSPDTDLSLHTATESMGSETDTHRDTELTSEIISVDDIDGPTPDPVEEIDGPTPACDSGDQASALLYLSSISQSQPSQSDNHNGPQSPQSPPNCPNMTHRGVNLAISIPRIQVSPEAASKPNHSPSDLSGTSDLSLPPCQSPSRIPSRKNSVVTAQVISEDLKKLESRLEKFVPKSSDGSECSEGSDNSGKSVNNAVGRLAYSQTASSRAKASEKSGSVSPQEKTTSNMLKTTLRKMTRFSMGGNGKKKDTTEIETKKQNTEVEPKSRSRYPFNGKSRVPKSQSPAPGVGRSKSFKEPAPPARQNSIPGPGTNNGYTVGSMVYSGSNGSTARNNVYTSSLRRTKIKHQPTQNTETESDVRDSRETGGRPITAPFGRSGTGGLERGAMRRSVSATRGATSSATTNTANRLVKKSRPVQTSLTRDPAMDSTDTENPGQVNFQVWLPELLGVDGGDLVETTVSDYSEPVDVRKNRALTLENMKLSREVERLKGHQGENELLRKELRGLRSKLEEEQKCRGKIQSDLEQYQERVRVCMDSMDSVERQFESRDLALQQLEGENSRVEEVGVQLRDRLGQAEQVIGGQKRELERSLAAQKTLIQQLQESEAEARELQEFLQAEKGTLVEALKEGEQEIKRVESEVKNRDSTVRQMEEQAGLLVRRAEQRSQELGCAKAEIAGVKDRAREMLLAQGAELSRASVAISSLTGRLEQLVGGEGAVWEENSNSDKSEESASDPAVNIDLNARRSSQFLVTPTESLDKGDLLSEFSRAMMTTSTGSDQLGMHSEMTSLHTLATVIQERQQLEGQGRSVGNITVPGLTEQLCQVENLVAKLMCVNMVRSQENVTNGNTNTNLELETLDLEDKEVTRSLIQDQSTRLVEMQQLVVARDKAMQEMRTKFSRNRQILTSNWEQAETEVRRLDEIYHDTVERVLMSLASVPDLSQQYPSLAQLVANLQLVRDSQQTQEDNDNKVVSNSNKNTNTVMSRSLVSEVLNNTHSSHTGVTSLMSQSQILTNSNTSGILTQSILSDPCLLKSPAPSLPSLLSTSALSASQLSREDMNANQSL